jgi:radical SAM superfamily enzyme YgiQ (UPF0313 family)
MGGPHPTFMVEESLSYADYVVRGEGEETIVELIECLEKGLSLNTINGLSYKTEENGIVHNPDRKLINDLNSAPIPDFGLIDKWSKVNYIPIATSRGCPFACNFCSVIQIFGRKYRFKSIDRVIEEIKAISSSKAHVFFVDDNFAADKMRTKELLQAMLDNNIKIEWSAQVRTDIARDPEILRLMAETGCFMVYIGFESINPKTLSLYNKRQAVNDIDICVKMLKSHNINIHGMFVLGSDMDDIHTIRNTQRYAKKIGIESIQFMMLTPLPGTPVFNELQKQGRLIHKDWSKYDAHHAVFEPKLMTAFELHIETLKAMAKFYSWTLIFRNLLNRDFFYSLIGLYGKKSTKKSISTGKKYLKHLSDMIISEFDKKTVTFKNNLLLKHTKTKNIILNEISLDRFESNFFAVFFKKLGKELIIKKEDFYLKKNTITITPFVSDLQNRYIQNKQYLTTLYEKYKDNKESVNIVELDSISLYRTCVNIGLLLNVKLKKIRKAYEKALAEIGGNAFECNTILIMVEQDL